MKSILEALGNSICEYVEEIKKTDFQWPDPQSQMDMPCLSILAVGTPALSRRIPEAISSTALDNGKYLNKYITGQWEHKIQVDLWCEYKEQREVLINRIVDFFDKQFIEEGKPTGVRLAVGDIIASYILTGYNYMDSEESAKTSEWRIKFDVVCDSPRVVEKEEFVMKQFTIKSRIDEFVNVDSDSVNEIKTF